MVFWLSNFYLYLLFSLKLGSGWPSWYFSQASFHFRCFPIILFKSFLFLFFLISFFYFSILRWILPHILANSGRCYHKNFSINLVLLYFQMSIYVDSKFVCSTEIHYLFYVLVTNTYVVLFQVISSIFWQWNPPSILFFYSFNFPFRYHL